MKHLTLIFALSISASFCLAQPNDDKAFSSNSFNKAVVKDNNIDSIFVTFDLPGQKIVRLYAFDKVGNLTYTVTFDQNRKKTSESFLTYNPQGQLISRKDREEEMLDDNTSYFYNAGGELEKAITKKKSNDTAIVTYTYDKRKLVEETRKEKTRKLVTKYKYDTQGRLFDLTILTLRGTDTKGVLAMHKSITYDNRGNKSREELTFVANDKDTINYRYDESNKLVLVQRGKDVEKYSYNSLGLLAKKDITKPMIDKPVTYTESYRYVPRRPRG